MQPASKKNIVSGLCVAAVIGIVGVGLLSFGGDDPKVDASARPKAAAESVTTPADPNTGKQLSAEAASGARKRSLRN